MKLTIAFVVLCIVWGTTYLGIRVAVAYMPPFFLSGIRHALAGAVFVLPFLLARRQAFPPLREYRYILLTGVLMVVLGNGLVCWAEQYISSGLAALIGAFCPILITLLSVFFFRDTRLNVRILTGLSLGIAGIIILFYDSLTELLDPGYRTGIALIIAANIAWAFGTIAIRKYSVRTPVFLATGLQMLLAGLINLMISLIFEPRVHLASMDMKGIWSLLYLILVGSVIGYGSFNYVLRHMPPARAAIHGYINTIIAVFLGWILLNEPLTWGMIAAMTVVLTGVYIVNSDYMRAKG